MTDEPREPEVRNEVSGTVTGGVVQAHTVHGGVHSVYLGPHSVDVHQHFVGTAPEPPRGPLVARSAYLEQVRLIAPVSLADRDRELAELASFCTRPVEHPYLWWRAGAWAGKSALLAWFVLHPPAGVRVVSFFITARYAGQSDRVAFADVLFEQLAELLEEPMPAYLTDATRDAHLLDMLARAATACERRGERLVLVVDGLDEDRGVRPGPNAYSIAALLPARPAAGMRVVVAGRANPPLPADVPDHHPLRDPATVRVLARSRHAEVVKADAQRELKHLLHGTRPEQDLLGLVAAAGGGLSGTDLAELTGWPEWEIEEHLSAVSGRTFGRRVSRWQPGQRPDVYVLAHEDLQRSAIKTLGATRIDGYRRRLHGWAGDYRVRGWPGNTPEYLLRGYFRVLQDTGDTPRMIGCATDRVRHDRMLDITGGDSTALAEITAVQDVILTHPDVDLLAMARLGMHRRRLAARNANIPANLPAVWCLLGHPNRAEALARSITEPTTRSDAMARLAEALATAGEAARAEAAIRAMTDNPVAQAEALPGVLRELVRRGRTDQAEALARSIDTPHWWLVPSLARAVAEGGAPDRAETIADTASGPLDRIAALIELIRVAAGAGDGDRARRLVARADTVAGSIADPLSQTGMLAELAGLAARTGDTARAENLIDRAETTAGAVPSGRMRESALVDWTAAVAATGDIDRAVALAGSSMDSTWRDRARAAVAGAVAMRGDAERADAIFHTIRDPYWRQEAGIALCDAAAEHGEFGRAEAIAGAVADSYRREQVRIALVGKAAEHGEIDRAETIARGIEQRRPRMRALIGLAAVLAAGPDTSRAIRLAAEVEALARAIADPDRQATELTALLRAVAEAGGTDLVTPLTDRAETAISAIGPADQRNRALFGLGQAVADAGDTRRAEAIARSITDLSWNARLRLHLGCVQAEAGDIDGAETRMRSLAIPHWRARGLIALLPTIAKAGNPAKARDLAGEIETLSGSIDAPAQRALTLAYLAEAVAAIGDTDRASALARRVEVNYGLITGPESRAPVLIELMRVHAACGDLDHAHELADRAGAACRSITREPDRERMLITLVEAIAATGELDRAEAVAHSVGRFAWSGAVAAAVIGTIATGEVGRDDALAGRLENLVDTITDRWSRAPALGALVTALVEAGQPGRAEALAGTITVPDTQARALAEVAVATGNRLLLGKAFRIGDWTIPLAALARLDGIAVTTIADEALALLD